MYVSVLCVCVCVCGIFDGVIGHIIIFHDVGGRPVLDNACPLLYLEPPFAADRAKKEIAFCKCYSRS